jgi:hypothetical protein
VVAFLCVWDLFGIAEISRNKGCDEFAAIASSQSMLAHSARPPAPTARQDVRMTFDNLLGGPPPTLLPADPAAAELDGGADPRATAAGHPASSLAWAAAAEQALADGDALVGYAFARVGYHRGLDSLRRNGWKGHGSIPWSHEPNRGFLRALAALAVASDRIGDTEESVRCREFLTEADPDAPRPD